MNILLIQGAQCSWVVTWRVDYLHYPHMTYPMWQKFNPHGGHMGRLTVKRDWPSTGVFVEHFGYFYCKYESVVSLGCPMLLGSYLEGKLGPLPLSYVTKI